MGLCSCSKAKSLHRVYQLHGEAVGAHRASRKLFLLGIAEKVNQAWIPRRPFGVELAAVLDCSYLARLPVFLQRLCVGRKTSSTFQLLWQLSMRVAKDRKSVV